MLLTITLQTVWSLSQHDFEQKTEPIFIKYYAPWCGHCQALKPTWEKLAEKLESESSQVTIGEVDCINEKIICSEQKVRGFPTLIMYMNGHQYEYNGDRSLDALYEWVNRIQGPAVSFYNSEEELKETTKKFGIKTYYVLHAQDISNLQNFFEEFKGSHFVGAIKGQHKLEAVRDGVRYLFRGDIRSKKDIHAFMLKNTIEPFSDLDDVPFYQFIRSGITMFLSDVESMAKKHKIHLKQLSQSDKFHGNLGFLSATEKAANFLKYNGAKIGKPNLLGGISLNNHGKIFTKIVKYNSYNPAKDLESQLKKFEQQLIQLRSKYETSIEQGKPLEGFLDSDAVKQVKMMISYNPIVQGLIGVSALSILFLVCVICFYNPKPAPKKTVESSQSNANKGQNSSNNKQKKKGQNEDTDNSKKRD